MVPWTPWRHEFFNNMHCRSLSRNVNSLSMPNLLPSGALTGPTKTLISLLTTDGNIFLSLEDTGNNTGNGLRQNSHFIAFYSLSAHTAIICKLGLIAQTWDISSWNRNCIHIGDNECHPLLSKNSLAICNICRLHCAVRTKWHMQLLGATTDFTAGYATWNSFSVITQTFRLNFSFNTIHASEAQIP